MHSIFMWGVLVGVIGFAASWFLDETPLRASASPEAEATGDEQPTLVEAH